MKAAKHLSATINQILNFSQIESGEITQQKSDFDLTNLVHHVDEFIKERALAKKLHYSSHVDPNIPSPLMGDADKLEQILINLVANAIKFTAKGRVSLEAQLLNTLSDRIELKLTVTDTGIGIEPSKSEQIFKPFEQADMGLTREYGGLGLGLSINHQLIKMMGGEMGVESVVGQGSQFWVKLRLKPGTTVASPESIESPLHVLQAMAIKPRILLVDDDYFNQSIFSRLLEEAGLPFESANDGAEALAKTEAESFDLILMDVQMPFMNGLEATRAIRKSANYQKTPIVAISANAFEEDRLRCFEAGMDAFLAKPVLPDVLFSELVKWLS